MEYGAGYSFREIFNPPSHTQRHNFLNFRFCVEYRQKYYKQSKTRQYIYSPPTSVIDGLQWYSSCKAEDDFYTKNDDEKREMVKRASLGKPHTIQNLMYTKQWCDVRTGKVTPVAVVTSSITKVTRIRDMRQRSVNGLARDAHIYKSFALINSWEELWKLFSYYGKSDRTFEEIILTNTPHRFFLDIEKDLDPGEVRSGPNSIEILQTLFDELFVPYLVEFFGFVGYPEVCEDDLIISYSSKPGVKFSVHIVVSTPQNHYVEDRVEGLCLAALLAAFLEEKVETNSTFADWYYFTEDHKRKCMIDYKVFGENQRNMRMTGCCKFKPGFKEGMHWKNTRVLLPIESKQDLDYSKFIISLYGARQRGDTVIELSHEQYVKAAEFVKQDDRRMFNCVSRIMEKAGMLDASRYNTYVIHSSIFLTGEAAETGGAAGMSQILDHAGGASVKRMESVAAYLEKNPVPEVIDLLKTRLEDFMKVIHPGNNGYTEPANSVRSPWVWKLRMPCMDHRTGKRRCFLDVRKGTIT